MNGWMNDWMNEWLNEWIDEWMNGWMVGEIARRILMEILMDMNIGKFAGVTVCKFVGAHCIQFVLFIVFKLKFNSYDHNHKQVRTET